MHISTLPGRDACLQATLGSLCWNTTGCGFGIAGRTGRPHGPPLCSFKRSSAAHPIGMLPLPWSPTVVKVTVSLVTEITTQGPMTARALPPRVTRASAPTWHTQTLSVRLQPDAQQQAINTALAVSQQQPVHICGTWHCRASRGLGDTSAQRCAHSLQACTFCSMYADAFCNQQLDTTDRRSQALCAPRLWDVSKPAKVAEALAHRMMLWNSLEAIRTVAVYSLSITSSCSHWMSMRPISNVIGPAVFPLSNRNTILSPWSSACAQATGEVVTVCVCGTL